MQTVALVGILVCILSVGIGWYVHSRSPKMLPTSTFAKLVAFEKRAMGLPLAEAIRIVPNYFAGWKVKTFTLFLQDLLGLLQFMCLIITHLKFQTFAAFWDLRPLNILSNNTIDKIDKLKKYIMHYTHTHIAY